MMASQLNPTLSTGAANADTIDLSIIANPVGLVVVPGLLNEISALGSESSYHNRNGRLLLLKKAKALITSLETPRETVTRHVWAEASNMNLSSGSDLPIHLYRR
jgi:hypothetical protein